MYYIVWVCKAPEGARAGAERRVPSAESPRVCSDDPYTNYVCVGVGVPCGYAARGSPGGYNKSRILSASVGSLTYRG